MSYLAEFGALPLDHGGDGGVVEIGVEVVGDRDDVRARFVAAIGDACRRDLSQTRSHHRVPFLRTFAFDRGDRAVRLVQRREQSIGCR